VRDETFVATKCSFPTRIYSPQHCEDQWAMGS